MHGKTKDSKPDGVNIVRIYSALIIFSWSQFSFLSAVPPDIWTLTFASICYLYRRKTSGTGSEIRRKIDEHRTGNQRRKYGEYSWRVVSVYWVDYGWKTEESKFDWGRRNRFFPFPERTWVLAALSTVAKRSGCQADHLPESSSNTPARA